MVNSGIQPYQNTNVLKRLAQELGEEKKNEWLQIYLRKGFQAIEETLKETSGKYCVGDEITIADLCLVPQVYAGHRYHPRWNQNNILCVVIKSITDALIDRFNIDMTDFPNIRRINSELEKLDEFRKAHANRQIDTPPELREN